MDTNVEIRKKAYALLDTGLPAAEVAKRLGITKQQVYNWSSATKREVFARRHGFALAAYGQRRPGRPPKPLVDTATQEPVKAVYDAATDLVAELERLRRENAGLRKLIEAYKEMTGV